MDARVHENCLKVQFGTATKTPSDKEIFSFFRRQNWAPDTLHAMFREPREHCVYVKFRSEDHMKKALLKCPATENFQYDNGDITEVSFATAKGNYKYVRIFGLPIEIENKEVITVLSKFGKVHSITRERYGQDTGYPIFNGVRGLQMELSSEIPTQVYIHHFQARIGYEGMPSRCFICKAPDHIKADCPKRSVTVPVQILNEVSPSTYAEALARAPTVSSSVMNEGIISSRNLKPLEHEGNNDTVVIPVSGNNNENDTTGEENQETDEKKNEDHNGADWNQSKKRGRSQRGIQHGSSSDSSEPEKSKVPRALSLQKPIEHSRLRSGHKWR